MLAIAIIAGVIWLILYVYSDFQIEHVPTKFNKYSVAKRQSSLKKYKFALSFIKLTSWIEKLLKVAVIVILVFVAPPVGFFAALAILWFRSSLKKTNYRGYATLQKRNKRQMRELDEWIIIANQTILK